MSHNTTNVGTKKPDASGNITVGLSDLSNVSGTASSHQDTIGVVSQPSQQDEENQEWWAQVTFAGVAFALAGSDIPDQGGKLNVSNGKVFVDNASGGNGIIAPIARGQSARSTNDLVMVDIR